MPKLFITGIVLFLLLGAGYGALQAARSIPWDCADWQAFAHEDRTTSILESLAENRGKTLYCGIDQSDTFGKAETWAAGKDRNERDDTVYWGERGSFRGFIAAQEGWLTEGESGITGQSIATIFEFPKEERRRRREKREYLRKAVGAPGLHWTWYYGPEGAGAADATAAAANARTAFNANLPTEAERIRYAKLTRAAFLAQLSSDAEREHYGRIGNTLRAAMEAGVGEEYNSYYHGTAVGTYDGLDGRCRALGYQRAVNIAINPWPATIQTSGFSTTYATRQVGATHYATARVGINYPGQSVDCVRIKK